MVAPAFFSVLFSAIRGFSYYLNILHLFEVWKEKGRSVRLNIDLSIDTTFGNSREIR